MRKWERVAGERSFAHNTLAILSGRNRRLNHARSFSFSFLLSSPSLLLSLSHFLSPSDALFSFQVAFKKFRTVNFDEADASKSSARKELYQEFKREVRVSGSLHHPRLVRLLGIVTTPSFGTVLEYMEMGDLFSFLQRDDQVVTWGVRIQIALDIAEGMRFLHFLKLIHRDLKSPNVLLTLDASDSELRTRFRAKIADFGLTQELEATVSSDIRAVVNPTWLAPEILLGQRPTLKVPFLSLSLSLSLFPSPSLPPPFLSFPPLLLCIISYAAFFRLTFTVLV